MMLVVWEWCERVILSALRSSSGGEEVLARMRGGSL